jgi:hypothetical protein
MSRATHFAKVFGIVWIIAMAVYMVIVYSIGFGVALPGKWHPSARMVMFIFWAWPVVPAFIVAGLWEALTAIFRMLRPSSAH